MGLNCSVYFHVLCCVLKTWDPINKGFCEWWKILMNLFWFFLSAVEVLYSLGKPWRRNCAAERATLEDFQPLWDPGDGSWKGNNRKGSRASCWFKAYHAYAYSENLLSGLSVIRTSRKKPVAYLSTLPRWCWYYYQSNINPIWYQSDSIPSPSNINPIQIFVIDTLIYLGADLEGVIHNPLSNCSGDASLWPFEKRCCI